MEMFKSKCRCKGLIKIERHDFTEKELEPNNEKAAMFLDLVLTIHLSGIKINNLSHLIFMLAQCGYFINHELMYSVLDMLIEKKNLSKS